MAISINSLAVSLYTQSLFLLDLNIKNRGRSSHPLFSSLTIVSLTKRDYSPTSI